MSILQAAKDRVGRLVSDLEETQLRAETAQALVQQQSQRVNDMESEIQGLVNKLSLADDVIEKLTLQNESLKKRLVAVDTRADDQERLIRSLEEAVLQTESRNSVAVGYRTRAQDAESMVEQLRQRNQGLELQLQILERDRANDGQLRALVKKADARSDELERLVKRIELENGMANMSLAREQAKTAALHAQLQEISGGLAELGYSRAGSM